MFFSAALLALPLIAQSVLAKDCTRKYTIKEGDICDGISASTNTSTYQLSAINPQINTECNNLVPGSELCLGYAGEDCTQTYVVRGGDTCDDVAKRHSTNTTMIFHSNPQIEADCGNLYVGEVLCVSGQGQAPAPPPDRPLPGQTIPTTALPANPKPTQPPAPAPPAPAPPAPAPPAPAPSAPAPSAPAPPPQGDDEDDENLPFCDEL